MNHRRILTVLFATVIASLASVSAHADRGNNCSADIWPGTSQLDCFPVGYPTPAVDVFDLLEVLANWGQAGPTAAIAAPVDTTDVFDLLELLMQWGDCPGAPCRLDNGCYVPEGWIGDNDCDLNCECVNGEFICEIDLNCNFPCIVDGKPYGSGTTGIPIDACNTCTCLHGELTNCTELTCFGTCFFMGKPVPHGEMIGGVCELCLCQHGVLHCDYSGCDCQYMGVPIMDGQTLQFGCEMVTCDQGTLIIDDSGCP